MFVSILRKIFGVLCIFAGIFFGFVPLIPGFILVFLGLELLGIPLIQWEKIQEYFRKKKKEEPKTLEDKQVNET